MSILTLTGFGVKRGVCEILRGVNLSVTAGELVGVIGPNGAGKTSLMRGALGLIDSVGACSLLDMTPQARAQFATWMPQAREIAWPVDVHRLVMLGRTPHLGTGQRATADDHAAVERAIQRMDLDGFRTRDATRLSGGEQARALIARALAQETPLLMADEPTAGLDPAHQIATMRAFRSLADEGRCVLVSLHDLGLAARHCTRLVVIDKGGVAADGPPLDVLSAELLRDTFGITAFLQQTDNGVVFQPMDVVG
ncbi:ABC transporter ATP-binding protein [uncultured Sulfitobacter sp.]|uniref:ABC transporter ATP-binding protein n=1 Tax=uncultured Sulfitobacter sp. TaxID=191468 RepID=UPI00262CF2BA|nr:ABC transporter ATP-binding protein [uncultured Sulfitobacter sp.]